jgi:hypothetical protein
MVGDMSDKPKIVTMNGYYVAVLHDGQRPDWQRAAMEFVARHGEPRRWAEHALALALAEGEIIPAPPA